MVEAATSTLGPIQKIKAGDQEAFSSLFVRYRRRLSILIHYKLGPGLTPFVSVRDILQETCLRAYRDFNQFTYAGPGSFLSWLSRIADHVLADQARYANRDKRRLDKRRRLSYRQPVPLRAFRFLVVLLATVPAWGGEIQWQHLSSATGDLPAPPGGSIQQTGVVAGDFDGDGVNDFIVSFRQKPPALVWYRRNADRWEAWVIEKEYLTVEAGGAVTDIDGDGDLDVVFGGDWQSNQVWWWENPAPDFQRDRGWKRHLIKNSGATQHHDQVFGDFLSEGRPQLAFWNQGAKTIFLAEIPDAPRSATHWARSALIDGAQAGGTPYTEGMSAFDVDADGRLDLLAYDSWYRHATGHSFERTRIAETGGLIFAGYFTQSKYPQIVISPGDGTGPVRFYECTGNPRQARDWIGRDLLDRAIVHGHSLQLGDIDQDGNLDIFVAEMAQWHENQTEPDHPEATAWILFGDGHGEFRRTELVRGYDWHETRLIDLDGDGDLDLLEKPYTWNAPRIDVWLNGGTGAGH